MKITTKHTNSSRKKSHHILQRIKTACTSKPVHQTDYSLRMTESSTQNSQNSNTSDAKVLAIDLLCYIQSTRCLKNLCYSESI